MESVDSHTDAIAQVRRFNRAVTQRVGALDDAYLARGRPLGQARVVWELREGPLELRQLRDRLGLDSGYLSRVAVALADDGLIDVRVDAADSRVRTVRLTAVGRRELAAYDSLSDAQASSMLEPLDPGRRERLLTAMAEVERLLAAASIVFEIVDPGSELAVEARSRYFAEIDERFETGYDPAQALQITDADLVLPAGFLVLASLDGAPVGSVAVVMHGERAHLKRMWVSPRLRGAGLGRRLLAEAETRARDLGASVVQLETNRSLHEAIALYLGAGYHEVPAFNDEQYGDHWFEKAL
jgi:DNA-binding MarR family transcriptional regulator/ribosomal protein S18 acetylase RimI-like enzyme